MPNLKKRKGINKKDFVVQMGKDLFIFVKYTHIHKRTRATFKFLLTHTLYLHSPVKKREMNRKYWIILVNETGY